VPEAGIYVEKRSQDKVPGKNPRVGQNEILGCHGLLSIEKKVDVNDAGPICPDHLFASSSFHKLKLGKQ
jgi:hypothetical protein